MPCQQRGPQYGIESLEGCIGEDGVKEVLVGVLKRLEVKNDCRSCIALEKLDDANVSQCRSDHCCIP